MPQTKRTNDEIYKELVDILDTDKTSPLAGNGDNIELDEDDERVLREIYNDSAIEGAGRRESAGS